MEIAIIVGCFVGAGGAIAGMDYWNDRRQQRNAMDEVVRRREEHDRWRNAGERRPQHGVSARIRATFKRFCIDHNAGEEEKTKAKHDVDLPDRLATSEELETVDGGMESTPEAPQSLRAIPRMPAVVTLSDHGGPGQLQPQQPSSTAGQGTPHGPLGPLGVGKPMSNREIKARFLDRVPSIGGNIYMEGRGDAVVVKKSDLHGEQCMICLEEFGRTDGSNGGAGARSMREIIMLPCSHFFHEPCLDSWICDHTKCPVCNQDLEAVAMAAAGRQKQAAAARRRRLQSRRSLSRFLSLPHPPASDRRTSTEHTPRDWTPRWSHFRPHRVHSQQSNGSDTRTSGAATSSMTRQSRARVLFKKRASLP